MASLEDGFLYCPDERVPFADFGRINTYRLNSKSECDIIGYPQCDNSTCYYSNYPTCVNNNCKTSSVICSSQYSDIKGRKDAFQCDDNRLILLSQFCDEVVDCTDGSDEIKNEPGFKCNNCVLPQSNLYDGVAHCEDKSDLCLVNNSCFECLDKQLLISSKQVCDGRDDCYDMSDECLCEKYFDSKKCLDRFDTRKFKCFDSDSLSPLYSTGRSIYSSNKDISKTTKSSFIRCKNRLTASSNFIRAALCDGRPECMSYIDECSCPHPPRFCNDSCHTLYQMGDRYCDGVEDPAWRFINDTACPKGFDEKWCPKRFKCKANGKVSIDVLQVCDGIEDCDDQSDENDCPSTSKSSNLFSSETEMIANPVIKSAFWIIGFIVLIGNAYVMYSTSTFLRTARNITSLRFQHVIILNISIADFIMGVYLLTIAAYSVAYSGIYGVLDVQWRSSLSCSIIGNLAVISSEASCLLMVVLTAFRLVTIAKSIESLNLSILPWKVAVAATWLVSFFLSFFPIFRLRSQYFVHSFSFSNKFQNGTWTADKLKQFACTLAGLTNTEISDSGNEYKSMQNYLTNNLSAINASVNFFGYYGETSVCLPRFYVAHGDNSWEYTMFLITFNFLSFLFIAGSYLFIYKFSSKSSANFGKNRSAKQTAKMQKRIARIIATDFCCWIPICIMAYVRFSGVEFSVIAYQITAVLLLPINSALNPFLFSSLPDKLIKFCPRKCKDGNDRSSYTTGVAMAKTKHKNSK